MLESHVSAWASIGVVFGLGSGTNRNLTDGRASGIEALVTYSPPDVTGEAIPAYQALDVRLGWRIGCRTQFSLDSQDLLHAHHVEFGAPNDRSTIRRRVYGKITWEL